MNSPIPDDWISAWLDGELTAEERRRFEAELEEDDELRQRVEAFQRLGERLRQLPTHRLPASFASEVVARSAGIEKTSANSNGSANRSESANGKVNRQATETSPIAPIPRSRSWYLAMGAIASLAAVVALAMAFPLWYPAAESQVSLLDQQVASGRFEIKSAAEAAPMPMASMPGMNAPEELVSGSGMAGAAGELNHGLEFGEGSNSMSGMRDGGAMAEAPGLFGAAGRSGEPSGGAPRGVAGAMRQAPHTANGSDGAGLNTFSGPGVQGGFGDAGGIGLQGGAGSQSMPDFQGRRSLDPKDAGERGMNWDQIAAGAAGAIIGQAVDRAMRRQAPAEAKLAEPAAAPAVASATGGAPAVRGGAESVESGVAAGGVAGGGAAGGGAAGGSEGAAEAALPGAPLAQIDLPVAGGVGNAPVDDPTAALHEAMAEEEDGTAADAASLADEAPASETNEEPVPFAMLALVDSPEVFGFIREGMGSTEESESESLVELSLAIDEAERPVVSVGLARRSELQQDAEVSEETTNLAADAAEAAAEKQESLELDADSQASSESLHRGEPEAALQVRVFAIIDSPARIQAIVQQLSDVAPRTWELQWLDSKSAWAERPTESSRDLRNEDASAAEEPVLKFRGRELTGEEAFSLLGWWAHDTKPTELPWQPNEWESLARSTDSQVAARYQMTLPQPERLAEELRIAAAEAADAQGAPADGVQRMTLWLVMPIRQPFQLEPGDGKTSSDETPVDSEIRDPSEDSEKVPMNSDRPGEIPPGQEDNGVPREPMAVPTDPTVLEPDAPAPRPDGDGEPSVEPSVEPMPEPTPEPKTEDPGIPSDVPAPMGDPNPLPSPSAPPSVDPPSLDPPKSNLSVPGETLQRSKMTR